MKKTILSLLSLGLVGFVFAQSTGTVITSVDQLPSTCIQATDADGNMCTRTAGGNTWACTLMYSEVKHPIQCLASTDDIDLRPTICTKEYMPVCGQPAMPVCGEGMACPQVMPLPQTYGNMCMANAAGATGIVQGECENISTGHIVGGDSDEHGCKGSAGYTRNVAKGQCTRAWEDEVKSSCKLEDKDLQMYSKDKASIKSLQSQLKKLGYFKIKPTGNFGPITKKALQQFQKDNGIQTTGKLGPVTRHAMEQMCTKKN